MKNRLKTLFFIFTFLFVIIAGGFIHLGFSEDLRQETINKLSYATVQEGSIITSDGYFILSSDSENSTRGIIRQPSIYSPILGYRRSNPNRPVIYSSDLNSYRDETLPGSIRDLLFEDLALDGDGDGRGATIKLTLNSSLQSRAWEVISTSDICKDSDCAVCIIENKTGAITGLISYKALAPSLDFNDFSAIYPEIKDIPGVLIPEYLAPCAPGSIFKILSSIPVIEENLEDMVYHDSGFIETATGSTIQNYGGYSYGDVTLKDALANSLNTYFVYIYDNFLGAKPLQEVADAFCLSSNETFDTDIFALPCNFQLDGSSLSLSQTCFGQGKTLVSPIQAASWLQAIMNDGQMMHPYLVMEKTNSRTERPYYQAVQNPIGSPIQKAVTDTLKDFLRNNAEVYDMKNAVAAKTGTAERSDHEKNASWILAANEDVTICIRALNGRTGRELTPIADELLGYANLVLNE